MAAGQKIRITVDLDPADHRALKIAAAELGMTISHIVRLGLSGFVRRVAEGERPTSKPRPSAVPLRSVADAAETEEPEPGSFAAVVAEIAAEAKGENPFDAVLDRDPDAG